MKDAGITNVTLNMVNPGPVNTDIARDAPAVLQPYVLQRHSLTHGVHAMMLLGARVSHSRTPCALYLSLARRYSVVHWMMNSFFKPPWKGAEPSLYAAVASEVKDVSGEYYDECLPCPMSFLVHDRALRERMWRATNQIVGTNPDNVRA